MFGMYYIYAPPIKVPDYHQPLYCVISIVIEVHIEINKVYKV